MKTFLPLFTVIVVGVLFGLALGEVLVTMALGYPVVPGSTRPLEPAPTSAPVPWPASECRWVAATLSEDVNLDLASASTWPSLLPTARIWQADRDLSQVICREPVAGDIDISAYVTDPMQPGAWRDHPLTPEGCSYAIASFESGEQTHQWWLDHGGDYSPGRPEDHAWDLRWVGNYARLTADFKEVC